MGYEQPRKSAGVTSVEIQNSSYTYAEDAGASDAYAITLSPAPTAYADGQTFKFKANTANTGAASLNVNSLGAKTIKKNNDQDLATGDIEAGSVVQVIYDADADTFELLSIDQNLNQDEIADGATNRSFTNTEKTKLAGIEEAADVTDAGNVGAVNAAAASKATPVNADSFPIVDSEASNVIKRLTFTNLKAFLKTYFDTLYAAVAALLNIVEDTTPQLGGELDYNQKNMNLHATPSVDHTAVGQITDAHVAGESITVMDLVYFKSDGKWWKTDADAEATTAGLLGIALETKSADQAMKVCLWGYVRDDTWNWTTLGDTLYADTATAGGLTATAPSGSADTARVVGYAISADVIFFDPAQVYVVIT